MKFKLFVLGGKNAGAYVSLEGESLAGRSHECQVRITSEEVSRKHCKFIQSESTLSVEDVGSLNGTYVNSEKINKRVDLKNGDLISIGNTRFVVVQEKDPPKEITVDGKALPETEKRSSTQVKAADALKKLFENR